MVVLLPNTLAHLSFELVFSGAYRIFSFKFDSLSQIVCFPRHRGGVAEHTRSPELQTCFF